MPKGHAAYKQQQGDSTWGEVRWGRGQRTRERKAGGEGLTLLFPAGSENSVQLQEHHHNPAWKLLSLREALCGRPIIH